MNKELYQFIYLYLKILTYNHGFDQKNFRDRIMYLMRTGLKYIIKLISSIFYPIIFFKDKWRESEEIQLLYTY